LAERDCRDITTRYGFLALLITAIVVGIPAHGAETYFTRPVRLVVPFPPGGGNDALGRLVADRMGSALGQRVTVDNRAGAGGSVGAREVIRSNADGYTLLLGHTGSLGMTPHLYHNAGYDPRRDLAPIGLIGRIPLVMVVHAQAPVRTMKQFVDLARIAPGKLNYGSGGACSGSHLAAELFAFTTGIRLTHVPYKGTAQTVTGLLAREIDTLFSVVPPVRAHVEAGTLRALALTSPERSPALPGVPTAAEEGLPGFEAVLNYGVAAPAGTPSRVLARLNAELNAALATAAARNVLVTEGVTPQPGTSARYGAVIAQDFEKWGEVIRKSGARVD